MEKTKNVILDMTFEFSLNIIDLAEELNSKHKFVVSQQILKSGTSIGANVREAQQAESNADFIHKMKIALKEASETEYWLLLCKYAKQYPSPDENLITKVNEIKKILSSIVISSRKRFTSKLFFLPIFIAMNLFIVSKEIFTFPHL